MSHLPLPPTLPGGVLFGSGPEAVADPLGLYTRAQRTLGDVVRLRGVPGLYWYLITHPSGVEHVLKTRGRNYRKPDRFNAPVRALAGNGILAAEGDSWLQNRRLMQPAFHRQRLAGLVTQMAEASDAASERWEGVAAQGGTVDASEEMIRVTLRIVGTTMFSHDLSAEADALGAPIRTSLHWVSRRLTLPVTAPEWMPTAENRRFMADRSVVHSTVDAMIAERRRSGETRPDLLQMLLDARDADTGAGMDDVQVRHEALTLMLAGHETTAAALSWAWYLLARHPQALGQMREELDSVLGGRAPGMDDLARLPYTRAVFDETLRLYPPAWGQPRESIEEDEIGGYRIPAGKIVMVCQWVTHRRPDLWDRPDDFVPERFLGAGPGTFPPFAYYPFGGGARFCIGSSFALMEAQVILATLAQRFEVDLEPGQTIVPDATFTLRPKSGIRMRLRRRTPSRAPSVAPEPVRA
ncbi:cytochrome P450 [Longimicrobium sp.]|uniref:cytochrome P450 n=1 Tax=Longimicrobium sp. TaxID=2029185 RepID=UPI002E32201A|nr:cytochrome P450 [Longimicrobium sp.]HEX6036575.1 cytochrome P450 [Longimicrobium sp.]